MASAGIGRIKLGSQGLEVSAQGLGCMGMSGWYGPPKPEQDMISLIHHAIHTGVTFLDTSDMYGPFLNEILLGKALKGGLREKVELATKFGVTVVDGKRVIRGDPAYVREACEASLKRLDVDSIDLYYQHRIDTRVPIEVTVGELKKLVEEGKIKYIGLSEASASTIRRAHAVHPITAVQLEWSLWSRDVEEEIIPTCRELGIGIVAYSPLGRGFFTSGPKVVENLSDNDVRKFLPRFQPENLEHNKTIFERVNEMATRKGCTTSQLALAWVHHQGKDVCPIPGTTKIHNFNAEIERERERTKRNPKMATALANRAASDRSQSLLKLSFNFLRSFSTASANNPTTTASSSSSASKKPKRKKKKNLFEVAQFLPNWGLGYHMAKTHWTGVSYQITKINLYKDGKHGKAWGIVHKEGMAAADAPKKISGVHKRCWRYIPNLTKSTESAPNLTKSPETVPKTEAQVS